MAWDRRSLPYESPIEDLFDQHLFDCLDLSVNIRRQVWVNTICGAFRIDSVIECDPKKITYKLGKIDIVAEYGPTRIAFECDGKQHDPRRDMWRDAMIFGAGAVDVIYHVSGVDIVKHPKACLFLIFDRGDRQIFSQRGAALLEALFADKIVGRNVSTSFVNSEYFDSHTLYMAYSSIAHRMLKAASSYEGESDEDKDAGDEGENGLAYCEVKRRFREIPGWEWPRENYEWWLNVKDWDTGTKNLATWRREKIAWRLLFEYAKSRGGGDLDEIIAAARKENKFQE
jgi:hypothetical protein